MIRTTAFLLAMIAFPGLVRAQEWLSDRRYSEGAGVRLGSSLVLHPGIGLEAGYDSNVFYRSATEDGGVLGAGRLRVTPHLDLATRPPQRLQGSDGNAEQPNTSFRLGVAAAYQEYLSGEEVVSDQRNVEVDAYLRGDFLRRQSVSVSIADSFARTAEPTNEVAFSNYDRLNNRADLGLKIAPGGRTLEFGIGYGFFINYFEDEEFRPAGNYLGHDLSATTRWKFFPKTALLFDAHVTPTSYYSVGATHPSSLPVRVRAGLNGLLTARMTLLAMVGYGAGFYASGDDYDSVIGQLELGYVIGPLSRLKVGYMRDFTDSIFSNYYAFDRGYLEYNQMIGGRLLLGIRAGVARMAYATLFDPGAGTPSDLDRVDVRADVSLFGEYRIKDWLAVNLSLDYLGNFTDWTYTTIGGTDQADFSKVRVFGGVRVFY